MEFPFQTLCSSPSLVWMDLNGKGFWNCVYPVYHVTEVGIVGAVQGSGQMESLKNCHTGTAATSLGLHEVV